MSDNKRWLDQLPLESRERELLRAGRAENPPPGAVDRDWQELRIALGGAAGASVVVTSKAAAATASAAPSALAVKTAGSGLSALVYAKSVAIGCAVALGALGGGTLVQRWVQPAVTAPAPPRDRVTPPSRAMPPRVVTTRPAESATAPPAAAETAARKAKASAPEAVSSPPRARAPESSLAEQAQELAQIKRLLDAGDTASALRRLESSFAERAHGQLSEERDALYVQALDKSGSRALAEQRASQFLARYPNSPHAGKMRALLP